MISCAVLWNYDGGWSQCDGHRMLHETNFNVKEPRYKFEWQVKLKWIFMTPKWVQLNQFSFRMNHFELDDKTNNQLTKKPIELELSLNIRCGVQVGPYDVLQVE